MKEYGGYIELDNFNGSEYYSEAVLLNCGRSCLTYLIKAKKIRKLYIPYFLCDTVKMCCEAYDVEYFYYNITTEFKPVLSAANEDDYVYVVNFYGFLSDDYIYELKDKYKNLILDNSQAFFRKPLIGIDTIYVCRKFFGVADGAYLYTDKIIDEKIEDDYCYDRMIFLLGRYEKKASEFYEDYVNNNKYFDKLLFKGCSKISKNILKAIDYEKVKNVRTENYKRLVSLLSNINELCVSDIEGAFAYPLLIEDGLRIKRELIKERIYIPTLWDDVFGLCSEETIEHKYAANILPLPVDQRYSVEDMEYIAGRIVRVMV